MGTAQFLFGQRRNGQMQDQHQERTRVRQRPTHMRDTDQLCRAHLQRAGQADRQVANTRRVRDGFELTGYRRADLAGQRTRVPVLRRGRCARIWMTQQNKGNNAFGIYTNIQNGQTQLATKADWQAATRRSAGRRPVARDTRNNRAGSRALAGGSRTGSQKPTGNERTTAQLQA